MRHCSERGAGHGSTFSIRLPLNKDEKTDGRSLASEAGGSKRRILVVDDNEDAADSPAALLEIDGQQSRAVYTPEAALEQVEIMKPDVVLLDIGLPEMSGYEVAKRIKATHPSVYVIAPVVTAARRINRGLRPPDSTNICRNRSTLRF